MGEQTCERCGLLVLSEDSLMGALGGHTPDQCIAALKRRVRRLNARADAFDRARLADLEAGRTSLQLKIVDLKMRMELLVKRIDWEVGKNERLYAEADSTDKLLTTALDTAARRLKELENSISMEAHEACCEEHARQTASCDMDHHAEAQRLRAELELPCRCGWDKSAADKMAAAIDLYIHRKLLDVRSAPADARLDYGEPMSEEKAIAVLEPGGT